ncbi:MAG TPA: hypothetical protein VIU82_08720 [Bosea sp. (in: a-proteobacteria)]
MPVEAPVMRTDGMAAIGLLSVLMKPIIMMDIMIGRKYDNHHVSVNGVGGEF